MNSCAAPEISSADLAEMLMSQPSEAWRQVFRTTGVLIDDLAKQGVLSPKLIEAVIGAAWRTADTAEARGHA